MIQILQRGVWIPIEVRKGDIVEKTSGLVNGGYRVEEPHIALPITLCKRLGIHPKKPEPYEPSLWITNESIEVRVVTEDRRTKWVSAKVHMYMLRRYIIISTSLAEALGIGIYKLHEGLWFFIDEGLSKIRKPAKPRRYPIRL